LRRRCDLEDSGVATTKQLRTLSDSCGMIKQAAAVGKQLLAFAGQNETAPRPIEKLEPELVFQCSDLARQGWLGNVQVLCRL
jgi:hypothetical protein